MDETHRCLDRQMETWAEKQIYKQTDRYTDQQVVENSNRWSNRQTDKQLLPIGNKIKVNFKF